MNEFVKVATADELSDGGHLLVEIAGELIAVFRVSNDYYAIDDVCTHDGGPLVDGELTGHAVACPRHGAKFDIRTGAALSMPAIRSTRSHVVKVQDGSVFVQLSDGTSSGPTSFMKPASECCSPQASVVVTPETLLESVPTEVLESESLNSGKLCEDLVRELLKQVKDPELFVNVVDLGLIYAVTLLPSETPDGKQKVSVDMTMTSPACPAGPQLIGDTKRVVAAHPQVSGVEVRIVMDPPWTPDRMTESAKDQLGIF